MKNYRKKTIATLLIAVFMVSMLAVAVNAVPGVQLISYEDGAATWRKGGSSGDSSVALTSGTGDGTSAGRIELLITPIAIADMTEPSFMLYETPVTRGKTYGGAYDVTLGPNQVKVPWGIPYINILLDLTGDGVWDEKLEGVGSTAGTPTGTGATRAVPHTAVTWTEMYEGWGYYDANDGIIGNGYSGFFVVHTLDDWKVDILTRNPEAQVVGVQITYGYWKAVYGDLGPVYVDDIKVNDVTYDFENIESTSIESNPAYPMVSIDVDPISISFADIIIGGWSQTELITVTHTGSQEIKELVTWTLEEDGTFYNDYMQIDALQRTLAEKGESKIFSLTLTVPDDATPGTHTATLVFWAEYAGATPNQN